LILVLRLLCWAGRLEPSHLWLCVLAGIFVAVLLLSTAIIGFFVKHDGVSGKYGIAKGAADETAHSQ
jgi:hypothetical protein